ncbi:MAG: DUF1810 domain-containing protein [Ginsengibacter sp.]
MLNYPDSLPDYSSGKRIKYMKAQYNLKRFTDAQESKFQNALNEIKNGRKQSHWMWFIFPQIAGLGFSETAKFYAIKNIEEASLYLQHPVLASRLIEISQALLEIEGKSANQIFGSPDDLKLKSSMTLFSSVGDTNSVFETVLEKYFNGTKDLKTLQIIQGQK